jgi:hypothetical protein
VGSGLSDTQDDRLRSVERLALGTTAALNDHLENCAERSRVTAIAVSELTVQVRHLDAGMTSLNKTLLHIGLRVVGGMLLLIAALASLVFYFVTGVKP